MYNSPSLVHSGATGELLKCTVDFNIKSHSKTAAEATRIFRQIRVKKIEVVGDKHIRSYRERETHST